MAKTQQYASMNPADAEKGGMFNGGVTTWKKLRFGLGYKDGQSENIITLQLTHRPKSDPEDRIEYFSCGGKAIENFTITKDGKGLKPKSGAKSIPDNCNAMILLGSVVKIGFPGKKLGESVTTAEGLVVEMRRKPIVREGLVLEGEDEGKGKTVLVASKIITMPKGVAKGAVKEDSDEGEDEDDDADDDAEADADAPDDDDEAGDDDADDEAGDDEEEEEEEGGEDEDSGDEEDEAAEVDDKVVLKHLKTLVAAAGGKLLQSKLGQAAFKALKSNKDRNAIVGRMVEDDLLAKAGKVGLSFNKKSGAITTK